MIVYVYPADPYGCGEYRLAMPARAMRAAAPAGVDVRLVMPSERNGIGGAVDTRTGRLVQFNVPPDADLIVLQRVAYNALAQGVAEARRRGVAVVVDMDDDLRRIDPSNPAWNGFRLSERHATGSDQHSAANTERACRDATLVTVSTPALLPVYAAHGRGVVIENRVPAAYLDIAHEDSDAIGWAGSMHSHPRDLDPMGPAVARAVRELGVEYWAAGPSYDQSGDPGALRRKLGLAEGEGEVGTTGDVPLAAWPRAVATMGIGLAPLADTEFNRAKSWLKPLEYMATGVPWIGSPRAEYARLAALTGVGSLAESPRDWYARIRRLVTDRAYRLEQSERGRVAIVNHGLTYEAAWPLWLDAWERAVAIQRGRDRAPVVIA